MTTAILQAVNDHSERGYPLFLTLSTRQVSNVVKYDEKRLETERTTLLLDAEVPKMRISVIASRISDKYVLSTIWKGIQKQTALGLSRSEFALFHHSYCHIDPEDGQPDPALPRGSTSKRWDPCADSSFWRFWPKKSQGEDPAKGPLSVPSMQWRPKVSRGGVGCS